VAHRIERALERSIEHPPRSNAQAIDPDREEWCSDMSWPASWHQYKRHAGDGELHIRNRIN
jgi:hypothetical protein